MIPSTLNGFWCALLGWAALLAATNADAAQSSPVRDASIVEIDGRRWVAEELLHETFNDGDWRERWRVEGNARLEVRDGQLHAGPAANESKPAVATVWSRDPIPANVIIEFTGGSVPPADENNAANLNLIVHAREVDGSAYKFGRSGEYAEYHEIPNYIFTLTGGFQPGWARVRRNPGFKLLAEDSGMRSEVGEQHRFRVECVDGRLRYWIDDRLVHDVVDAKAYTGGHFALRTWRSRVWWSDVRVRKLLPVSEHAEQARPWFKSGFEGNVVVGPDNVTGRETLLGRDETTGFDWTSEVPAQEANFFYLLNQEQAAIFAPTALEQVAGRNGTSSRALRMEVTGRNPDLPPGALNRSEFSLFYPAYDQAYVRYWMKLQDNYLEASPRDHAKSWRMFFELKEPDSGVPRLAAAGNRHTGTNNYRMSFYIRRKPEGDLYWHVRGEAPQPLRSVDWDVFNDRVPVPIGRWFKVEVFFRRAANDGVIWLAIDGEQVVLWRGRTQHPDRPLPMAFYSPFKLYQSPEWLANGPNHQWIDDVEFWPGFPADATPRDESQANRSTFVPPIADQAAASSPAPRP